MCPKPTARAWLSILEASFIVFRLPPFHRNQSKKLVKSPKLHFYDTGLVCWLIGIRTPEQLGSHPLRGPIFETWVVSEIVKHRMNLGETRGIFFYRSRDGAEVDLDIEHPSHLTLIGAKSSQTPSSSLFDGTYRVRRHLVDSSIPWDVVVAYGGDESQERAGGRRLPWDRVHEATI